MTPRTTSRLYRVHEFAALAGVTVRALHHYDRLGLLTPRRSGRGYRLYTQRDLGRLEQIVVLKFLGLPLKQIRKLLGSETALPIVLGRQRWVLECKRRHLDNAIRAIGEAEASLRSTRTPDWTLFKRIIQEVEMQRDNEWAKKYYSAKAQETIEEHRKRWTPELQAEVSRTWAELYADIEAAIGEPPASPRAQALAARWRELVSGFTGGDPEVAKGLNAMWADQANWPAAERQSYGVKPEIQAFITAAMRAARPS
jgi:DNA-binding transcriptional MerR regulator